MKTNKLAIAILAATLPTLANANEDINQILGGNQAMENPGFQAPQAPSFPAVDENMSNATNLGVISAPQGGHPNDPAGLYGNDPMMGQNGVPGMNAQPNGMMPNPINPMGMQQGQVVQKYLQAEDEDNLKVDPNNYLEDETAAAEAVISSINDKIVRKDQSEISKFEEIDEYKSEIRVIEMKSQMAAMEAELIKSQAEIKKIRDEMNVDKTRERVEKEVLKEYNKKVKELKGKHNKEIAKLEKVIIEKETEVKKAEGTVKKKEAEYKKLQGDMEALGKAKDQEIAYMAEEVLKKMEEISSLEKAIEDMQKQEEEDMSEILREEHVALAKIFGRGDQLKAKLYVLENVFEIQEEDDIKNDGTVIVKEITSEYVVLTMNEEDFTFYPMGEKRAAIMVSNALARQQNQEVQRELERLNNGLQSVMNPGNLNQGFDNQMGMQPGFDPNMQMMQQPMMQQPMMQQSQPMMMPQPTGAMNGPQQTSDVVNFSSFDGMSPEQMPPQGEVYTQGGATVNGVNFKITSKTVKVGHKIKINNADEVVSGVNRKAKKDDSVSISENDFGLHVFNLMVDHNIGRPSTWVKQAKKIIEEYTYKGTNDLNRKANNQLRYAEDSFRDLAEPDAYEKMELSLKDGLDFKAAIYSAMESIGVSREDLERRMINKGFKEVSREIQKSNESGGYTPEF